MGTARADILVKRPSGPSIRIKIPPEIQKDLTDEQIQDFVAKGLRFEAEAPPTPPVNQSRGNLRRVLSESNLTAAGGVVGAVAGIPAAIASGPLAPATEAGAIALGAAGGKALFDTVDDIFNAIEGTDEDKPLGERLMDIAKTGVTEGAFVAGTMGAGPLIRGVSRNLLGLTKKATREIAEASQRSGIPLGSVDVATGVSGVAQRASIPVLAVFPVIGAPARNLKKMQAEGVMDAQARILNELGPNVSLSQLGIDTVRAAEKMFGSFKAIGAAKYSKFYSLAEQSGARFPGAPIRDEARAIVRKIMNERPPKRGGGSIPAPRTDDEISGYIAGLTNLADDLTAAEVRAVKGDLERLVKTDTSNTDMALVSRIAAKQEESVQRVFAPNETLPLGNSTGPGTRPLPDAVTHALEDANNYWATWMATFERPTGKLFGKVDKRIFKAGRFTPATRNEDEAVKAVVNGNSAQAIRDLRSIVGEKDFAALRRNYIEGLFEAGMVRNAKTGEEVFDPFKFVKKLGNNPEPLNEMLKGTGVTPGMWDSFVKASLAAGKVRVADPSTFVTRRIVMGGVKAGAGTFLMASGTTSPLVTIPAVLGARGMTKVMTNPETLQKLTLAIKPTTSDRQRLALVGQIIAATRDEDIPDVPPAVQQARGAEINTRAAPARGPLEERVTGNPLFGVQR